MPRSLEVLAAADDGLNGLRWGARFAPIERCHDLFYELEEVGRANVPWATLVEGLTYFDRLSSMNFPPCYDPSEFGDFDGIDVLSGERAGGAPGMDFVTYKIYIRTEKVAEVLGNFAALADRLTAWLSKREKHSASASALLPNRRSDTLNPKPESEEQRRVMEEEGDDAATGAMRIARFRHQNAQFRAASSKPSRGSSAPSPNDADSNLAPAVDSEIDGRRAQMRSDEEPVLETEEDGIRAEQIRREQVRRMAQAGLKSPPKDPDK